ncbi:unnamed protein product [Rotaria socialis]|uniref:Reverse transcriptase Ty1/copia-type domain-containing protein n=1 Tax=Rotaria socialis TaxID=392032 RepID=A0A821W021_9BILA|nr:unnamed protein product [Rotaria socialis]
MISLGYRRLNYDGCLFVRNEHQLLSVYVDDIIIAAPDDSQLNNMLNELEIVFKIRDLGNVSRILGLDVYDEKERIIVKQTNYIKSLLTKYNMWELILIRYGKKLQKKTIVGSLLYLSTVSRPDLCFAVGSLARYTEFEHHLFEPGVKRILRYLRGTLELGIVFKKFKSIERQNSVATSTCKAGLTSMFKATVEAVGIKNINEELLLLKIHIHLHADNRAAISIAMGGVATPSSRHFKIVFSFLKELTDSKILQISYVDTKNNMADVFTKALNRTLLNNCKNHYLGLSFDMIL